MKNFKRLLSAFLVLTVLACWLCSCDFLQTKDPAEVIAKAEYELTQEPYKVDMKISYSSDDPKMKEAVDSSSQWIKLSVDGENFEAELTQTVAGKRRNVIHTFVGNVMYTTMVEDGETDVEYTPISDKEKEEYRKRLGEVISVSTEDFESVKIHSVSGVDVINCTSIKDAPLYDLIDFASELIDEVDILDALVTIKDVTLDIQLREGRYDITIFTCDYVITVGEEVYTLKMTYSTKFNYGGGNEIKAPEVS